MESEVKGKEKKGPGGGEFTLLLDVEPLTGATPLRHRLGEHGHEVLVVVARPP